MTSESIHSTSVEVILIPEICMALWNVDIGIRLLLSMKTHLDYYSISYAKQ